MSSVRQVGSQVALHRRMCLSCGYDGESLQDTLEEIDFRCPACNEDLYTRPPRSYAQMEGLSESSVVVAAVQLEEWSRRLLVLEHEARTRHRPQKVVGLILGSAIIAAAAASIVFLTL